MAKRGISFKRAREMAWDSALIVEDTRQEYDEARYLVPGAIEGRLHALVFTPRGHALHIISLRKANRREVRRHAQHTRS
ncbi:MAG: BrnT family toxin [Magnetococcales bacterium]|nr:BrnT family toxin [Magnetococcales bacterium]